MNNLLESALLYAERGWRIFPLSPGTKKPFKSSHGVKDATTDENQIKKWWASTPNANIGVACGPESGVYVVDIDIDEEKSINGIDSLEEFPELPNTPRQTTPRGGFHAFFQSDNPPVDKIDFRPGIDIRSDGFYVVLAPSISENGIGYQWEPGKSPLDIPLAPFPKFMRPLRFEPSPAPKQITPTHLPQYTDTLKRASAYLSACEPAIQGRGGHNKLLWAASVLVRGFELSSTDAFAMLENEYNPRCEPPWNLQNPRDLKDFRRKVDEAKRNPPDKPRGWLLYDSGVESDPEMDKVVENLLATEFEQTEEGEEKLPLSPEANEILDSVLNNPLPVVLLKEWNAGPSIPIPSGFSAHPPEELSEELEKIINPPGLLGNICKWINGSAFRDQPLLAVGCSLTFLGVLFGRKLKDELGNRTNLYNMGVARSSAGKDHAMKCIRYLCKTAGITDMLGGSAVASEVAVVNRLAKDKSVLYMWDEIGFLLAAAKSHNAGSLKMLIPTLMQLYSAASDIFVGREYADTDKQIKLTQPCCGIWGTSEIKRFIQGLNPDELTDGWLSRCMVWRSDTMPNLQTKHPSFEDCLPEGIVEMVGEWYARKTEDKDISEKITVKHGNIIEPPPQQILVPTTDKAKIVFDIFLKEVTSRVENSNKITTLWAKAYENVRKVALIVAGSENFYEPKITEDVAEYAVTLVRFLLTDFCNAFVDDITDSRNEEMIRRAFHTIENTKHKGCRKSFLTKQTQSLKRYEREAVISDLIESEQIVSITDPACGRGRPATTYWTTPFYKEKIRDEQAGAGIACPTIAIADSVAQQSSGVHRGQDDEGGSSKEVSSDNKGTG